MRKNWWLGILLLAACTPGLMPPTQQQLDNAPINGKSATLDELRTGHTLYTNKCGNCHYLYKPEKYTEERWKKDLPEMADRAKIDAKEQELILKYLLTMRESALNKGTK